MWPTYVFNFGTSGRERWDFPRWFRHTAPTAFCFSSSCTLPRTADNDNDDDDDDAFRVHTYWCSNRHIMHPKAVHDSRLNFNVYPLLMRQNSWFRSRSSEYISSSQYTAGSLLIGPDHQSCALSSLITRKSSYNTGQAAGKYFNQLSLLCDLVGAIATYLPSSREKAIMLLLHWRWRRWFTWVMCCTSSLRQGTWHLHRMHNCASNKSLDD